MTLVIISMTIGIAVGFLSRGIPAIAKNASRITLFGLFFLLFVMGLKLGASREVLDNLGQIGAKAFIIALFCVMGSVFLVQLAAGFIGRKMKEAGVERQCKGDECP